MSYMTPQKIFQDDVSQDFIDSTLRALIAANKAALASVSALGEQEVHDVLTLTMRAHFESTWRGVVAGMPNVQASPQPNANGGAFHTEVVVGRVRLTANSVSTLGEFVRPASFRETLARSPQMDWLRREEEEETSSTKLYCLFLYGRPDPKSCNGQISLASFAFPNRSCSAYVGAPINVSARLAELRGEGASVAKEEVVADELVLGVRANRKPGSA